MKQPKRKMNISNGIIVFSKKLIRINPNILIIINNKYKIGTNIIIDKNWTSIAFRFEILTI